MRCEGFLIEAAQARLAAAGLFEWAEGRPKEFAPAHVADRIIARFKAITGVAPSIPAEA